MKDHTKVFIVDDDPAVRDSLTLLMETAGYNVASFGSASEFLEACNGGHGCIILDVDMPDIDGPALQEELIRRGIQLPVIFLSGKGTIPITVRTIKAGAMDFLTKPMDGSILLSLVQAAFEKSSLLQNQILANNSIAARLKKLTDREREVMMLAVKGQTSKEIAQHLGISFRTVEIHRAHLLQKTGASNLMELAHIANTLASH
jgi:two-component system, LuxR family, response regulator FixJ